MGICDNLLQGPDGWQCEQDPQDNGSLETMETLEAGKLARIIMGVYLIFYVTAPVPGDPTFSHRHNIGKHQYILKLM